MHVRWNLLAVGGALATVGMAAWLAGASMVPTLVRGPYLQLLSTDGVTVVWNTDAAAGCALTIRQLPGGATGVIGGGRGTECEIRVDGLLPGTGYAYTPIGDGFALDDEAVFRTDARAEPFTFLVVGDSGSGGPKQYAVRDRMIATRADFIVHTGDMIYPDGEAENFDRKFFRPYRSLLRSLVFWPTLGNHDVDSNHGIDHEPWYDVFRTPANNAAGDEGYYSFDFGIAHIIVLDTNASTALDSPQRSFLEQDLAASTARWNFVVFHHTIYSTGEQHGSDESKRANLLPILDENGVDVVFMGHEHIYERTFALRGNAIAVPPARGTVYVTTGGGGFTLHTLGPPDFFTAHAESSYHFVRVAIDGGQLRAQMIRDDGTIGDAFTIAKGGVPPPATCGDGLVNDPDEQCDGADRVACAGPCAAGCICAPVCGDGRVNGPGEECDGSDAGACAPNAFCRANCTCDDGAHVRELPAVADTYVEDGSAATRDHGGFSEVFVDADPASVAYLTFDLSDVTDYVVRATLSLHVTNSSLDGGTVFPVRDGSWIEGTGLGDPVDDGGPGLKWTDVDRNGDGVVNDLDTSPYAPVFDRRAGALVDLTLGSRAEADVTSAFRNGPGFYGLAILKDAGDRVGYFSREDLDPARRPLLRLETGAPPVTTTITTTTVTTTTSTTTTTTSTTTTSPPTTTTSSTTTTSTTTMPTATSSTTVVSSSTTSSTAFPTTTSTLAPIEVCNGGVDEDGDGDTDCDDADCTGNPACARGCGVGPEWGSIACRVQVLAGQVDATLPPRRLRTSLVGKLGRAASARLAAEAYCASGQARRAREALRGAQRALTRFRRQLNSEAGRRAVTDVDRAAWRALAAEMHRDLETLRATLACGG